MENLENNEKPKIEVVEAELDDVRGISAVQEETWLATYPNEEHGITREDILAENFYSAERVGSRREVIGNPNSLAKFWVAKDGATVVGYCSAERSEECNKIRSLYVLPNFHGQGIGTRLIEQALQYSDKTKPTKLTVAVYNDNAISFYEKFGFKKGNLLPTNSIDVFPSGKDIPEIEMIRDAETTE